MTRSPDKLSLIVQSGDFDRVHYALVVASAALATGKSVTLFFTMEGTRALLPGFADVPQETMLAQKNLATFEELIAACAELDATFMVCEMGMRATAIGRAQFRPISTSLREVPSVSLPMRRQTARYFTSETRRTGDQTS